MSAYSNQSDAERSNVSNQSCHLHILHVLSLDAVKMAFPKY